MVAKSNDEQRWQAQSDARTLAEYQQIIGDKPRMQRAVREAKQQAADLTKRANAMQSAASYAKGGKMSVSKRTTVKTSRRKK